MSVFDRAIVRAFERRRTSAADPSAVNGLRGATDQATPSIEAATANTLDAVEQLLVEIGIADPIAAPPSIVVSPPASDFFETVEEGSPVSETEALALSGTVQSVVESAQVIEPPASIVTLFPQEVPEPPFVSVPLPPPVTAVTKSEPPPVPAPATVAVPTAIPAPAAVPTPVHVTERELAKYVGPAASPPVSKASQPAAATPPVYVPPPVVSPTVAYSKPIGTSQPLTRDWQWPEICEQLDQFTGDGFRQLAKHLQFAAAQGHKVLAFVSSKAGAGRTSVLLTLTRILALEGRTDVLLLDADRRHPDLGKLTKLQATLGLSEVLHGQATLEQAVVHRTPGNISLLPLLTTISDAEWLTVVGPLRTLMKQLKHDHDMVLVDAGVLGPETRLADCWLRGAADAVITISRQLTGKNAVHEVLNWKQIGIESLGVIETFA